MTQAARYERSEARQSYRSGHYDRNLSTTSGDVKLHVLRLKGVSFETAIIERYRRRESSVEEALIEMYFAGVSVRRVEDITEAQWGSKASPATMAAPLYSEDNGRPRVAPVVLSKSISGLSVDTLFSRQTELLSGYLDGWEHISFEDK